MWKNGKEMMIEKINNNPSEMMLEYGFNVVVDESIVTRTNQFTYTDKRMIDKVTFSFGDIRIFARDYYKNGIYFWAECYIL